MMELYESTNTLDDVAHFLEQVSKFIISEKYLAALYSLAQIECALKRMAKNQGTNQKTHNRCV